MSWPIAPLPWQAELWTRISQQVQTGRLPHALLLTGSPDVGKRCLLQALAASLLCANPENGIACGRCKSCQLLMAGSHSDLLDVAPEEGGRLIKVDQIRKLISFASQTPALGARKIILLGPAESMNISAANALLKILEEPSVSTNLLLHTSSVSNLPATLRSRCQTVTHPSPASEAVLPWLAAALGAPEAEAALAAVEGQPMSAMKLGLEDGVRTYTQARQSVAALLRGELSALELPSVVKDVALEEALLLMQRELESAIRSYSTGSNARNLREIYHLRDDLARKRRAVLAGANPNRQLLIEDYSARLQQAFR
ncbi:MAG: DNA polymerase III subunit delta' [Pseudomonadota bacterium]